MEFALIAFPFFAMLFAILEIALIFTVDSILDNAVIDTGRLVRTGQASAASMTKEQFKEELCKRMSIFAGHCRKAGTITIDVQAVEQFAVNTDDPFADGDASDAPYTNGVPGDLMIVRVWYAQPLITAFMAQGLNRQPDGTTRLSATTAFRNEPS